MSERRTIWFWLAFSWLGIGASAFGAAKQLTISCGANGIERQLCQLGVEAWSKKTGIPVQIFSTPNESNERLSLYQQLLAARSKDVDVFQIDAIWPGLLATHFVDLSKTVPKEEQAAHFPRALENNSVEGKLIAMPWFTDAGVLYVRKDLLKKYGIEMPKTWPALEKAAKTITEKEKAAGNKELWGYVFQGKPYEGLTCNAVEWMASYGAPPLFDAQGNFHGVSDKGAEALKTISSWVGTLSPPGVLSYAEEEARGVFQSGKSIFMRNWPYAWALLNSDDSPVKGKVAITTLPAGPTGESAATLGGWSLAVSTYSANQKEATELVRYLTGPEQQKMRSLQGSFNPSIKALYDDADLLKKNPQMKELQTIFLAAVARPAAQTKGKYNRWSADYWNAVYGVLAKGTDATAALKDLETRVGKYLKASR